MLKPSSPNINSNQTEAEANEYPPIIVRFVNRDKRNEIFDKRLRQHLLPIRLLAEK